MMRIISLQVSVTKVGSRSLLIISKLFGIMKSTSFVDVIAVSHGMMSIGIHAYEGLQIRVPTGVDESNES